MFAYHISGTAADAAEHNVTPERAAELAAAGWFISDVPIVWAENQYVDGNVVAISKPEIIEPEPVVYTPYVPTAAERQAALVNAVQGLLDSAARSKGYDNIVSAVSYAPFNTVGTFQNEALALGEWRSSCWDFCYDYLAQVQAGAVNEPTSAELLSMLPTSPFAVIGNDAGVIGNNSTILGNDSY